MMLVSAFELIFFTLMMDSILKVKSIEEHASSVRDSFCEGWTIFKEEKKSCVKFFDLPLTYEGSKKFCNYQDSELVKVKTERDQLFIEKIVNEVRVGEETKALWIEITSDSTSDKNFTNWKSQSPQTLNSNHFCPKMLIEKENRGKWELEDCSMRNAVICEKSYDDVIEALSPKVLGHAIPPGWIYFQFGPQEKSPAELWPLHRWEDVSQSYADHFFTVTKASDMYIKYNDNIPLIRVISVMKENGGRETHAKIGKDFPDDHITTGYDNGGVNTTVYSLHFEFKTGPVNPMNLAVKIWKRV